MSGAFFDERDGARSPTGSVVVGADGSLDAWSALLWAVARAVATSRRVLVVHAGHAPHVDCSVDRDLVATVVAQVATGRPPDLDVMCVPGDASEVLLSVAARPEQHAELLVVGRGGRTGLPGHGRVTARILRAALVPVAVVAAPEEFGIVTGGAARARAGVPARVVVGASATPNGLRAVEFACDEAARSGAELVVVRGWSDEAVGWSYAGGLPVVPIRTETLERTLLDRVVDHAHTYRPDLRVRAVLRNRPAEIALQQESRGAAMVVLGYRRVQARYLSRVGPLTDWAERHLRCPVVAVPPAEPIAHIDVPPRGRSTAATPNAR